MGRPPRGISNNSGDEGTPKEYPQVTPPVDLYPTSDIRFVMVELGKLSTKVDRLIDDVEKAGDKVSDLSKKIASFETAAKVIGAALAIIAAVFWWVFGDYMKSMTVNALRTVVLEQQTKPQEQAPNVANTPPTGGIQDAPARRK